MKISHRLIALSDFGVLAVAAAGAACLHGVHAVRERIDTLAPKSVPVRGALLERREVERRTIGALVELARAGDEAEMERTRREARERFAALDADEPPDAAAFASAFDGISAAVSARLARAAKLVAAAEATRLAFGDVDARLEKVGAGVRAMQGSEAAESDEEERGRTRDAGALIADMTVLLYEIDAGGRSTLAEAAGDAGAALARIRPAVGSVRAAIEARLADGYAAGDALSSLTSVGESPREAAPDTVSDAVEGAFDEIAVSIVTVSAVAALASLALALIVIRSIAAGLRQTLRTADALAKGQLRARPSNGRRRDEISLVTGALERAAASHGGSMREVRTLGGESAAAARRTSGLSESTSRVAAQGRQAARDAMESMQSIESGAREISDITAVIDAIAFQTDILALDAAVEASRAGGSGRGFAVVAAGIGSLARKSKESVLRIEGIVEGNVQHVETGSTLVRQARHVEEVVERVDGVVKLIGEVSASNQRQVDEIARIDGSIGELEQMIRQDARLSRYAASKALPLLKRPRALDGAFDASPASNEDEASSRQPRNRAA